MEWNGDTPQGETVSGWLITLLKLNAFIDIRRVNFNR
jgi:hypothetical protein